MNNNSISSLNTFQDLPYIEEFNVKEIINKINKISSELIQNDRKNISLFDLISLLEQKNIYLNKNQALQLLKYLEIQNSNSFGLNEFIEKVKTKRLIQKYHDKNKDLPSLNLTEIDKFANYINDMIEKRVD